MGSFDLYLGLGFEHISDINAYDHILFITALCAVYKLHQWKHILILVTAFTVGHSVTLALSALQIITIPSAIIEFLIPVTILATAIYNVLNKDEIAAGKIRINYFLALFFGFIHGMGFSNYFRALLGGEESIVMPLFAFNLGLEIGQILIVVIIMGLSFLAMNVFHAKHREWNLFISGAAAGVSLTLMLSTWPF